MKANCLKFFLFFSFLVSFCSCVGDKEEKIVGKWQREVVSFGGKYIETYDFGSDNTVTIKFDPRDTKHYGYTVKGTWEIDVFGKLILKLDENTLSPIYYNLNYIENAKSIKSYISGIKKQIKRLNAEMEDGAGIMLTFNGDDEMTFTMLTEKQTFKRVKEKTDTKPSKKKTTYDEGDDPEYEEDGGDPDLDWDESDFGFTIEYGADSLMYDWDGVTEEAVTFYDDNI